MNLEEARSLKCGVHFFHMVTTHALKGGKVIEKHSLVSATIGADYGNTTISPKTIDEHTGKLVYVPARKASYTYVNAILARYNKSQEWCLPMRVFYNSKWKHVYEKHYFVDGQEITEEKAIELGYHPNKSGWIVPKLSSIVKEGR